MGALRRIAVALAALLPVLALALLTLVGCGEGAADTQPHILLVVIDTLRSDHLGAYGYGRPTSPQIDGLASSGVVFTRADAPSSWTKPSVGSLFTSRHPSEHGAVSFDRDLDARLPTLAEGLREAGYRTVGVSGNFVHVSRRTGFARGFDAWETLLVGDEQADADPLLTLPDGAGGTLRRRAPRANEVNLEVLSRLPAADGPPLFLYVHYMEPHPGYAPSAELRAAFISNPAQHSAAPPATAAHVAELAATRAELGAGERQRLVDLYDAEIAAADAAVGELLAALGERGFGEDLVTVIVSDHGEEFGDHGGWFHGLTLQHESLRVPLVLHDSRAARTGVRRDEPVDLLDVPTTLLALAGADALPGMRGRDLLADALPPRELRAELHADAVFEASVRPRVQRAAVVRWPWKAIAGKGTQALYRLDRDPLERDALSGSPEFPADLAEAANRLAREVSDASSATPAREPTPEEREGLRSLGYAH